MSIVNPHDQLSWPLGYTRPAKRNTDECTPEQLKALRMVYDRGQLDLHAHTPSDEYRSIMPWGVFRDAAQLDREGVLMVYWNKMWLGIEKDGYTHS